MLRWGAVVLFVLVIFLAWGASIANSPEGKERANQRHVIEGVCAMQDDDLQELMVRRAARQKCEDLKQEFRNKWGMEP